MDNHGEGRARGDRLERGVQRFRERVYRGNRRFFQELEEGQRPHTLFITCSDSRVDPTLLTDSRPGELFIVRNIANIVPPYRRTEEYVSTTAAIEYALLALKVSSIVVCGHSNCGGCAALLGDPETLAAMPHTERWLELARESGFPPPGMAASELERENVVRQADRLLGYPTVRERLAAGCLVIHAWHYAIGRGAVRRWEATDGAFRPLPVIATRTTRKRRKRWS